MRKPFFWKQRKCWYVRSEDAKTNIRLDPDESKAFDIWNEMRIAAHPEAATATYAVIAEAYLEGLRGVSKKHERTQRDALLSACKIFGGIRVIDLRKHHVTRWLDKQTTWGDWARRGAAGAIVRSLNWAVDQGYLKTNPLSKLKLPKGGRREGLITDEMHAKMMQADDGGRTPGKRIADLGRQPMQRNACFRPVMIALRHSGTRPGMVAVVSSSHVTPGVDAWIFKQHKTKGKTKKPLVVQLSPCLQTLTRIVLHFQGDGPLFRNSLGNPWKPNSIRCRMRNLQTKLELPEGTVAYAYRHSWTTNAILNGVDIATVATMLGHKDLRMLMEHYSHLEKQPEHLKQAAAKAVRRKMA